MGVPPHAHVVVRCCFWSRFVRLCRRPDPCSRARSRRVGWQGVDRRLFSTAYPHRCVNWGVTTRRRRWMEACDRLGWIIQLPDFTRS